MMEGGGGKGVLLLATHCDCPGVILYLIIELCMWQYVFVAVFVSVAVRIRAI